MVSRAIITEWFDKNLGIASGIASTGAGFGQLALAPVIAILNVKLGIMYTFVIVGGLTGSSVLFGLILSIPPTKDDEEKEESANNNKIPTELVDPKEKGVQFIGFSFKNKKAKNAYEDDLESLLAFSKMFLKLIFLWK